MSTFGERAAKGIGEKAAVRQPFIEAVLANKITDWEQSLVFADVPVDNRKSQPDVLLIGPSGRVAVVECKRCSAGQAKKGMFEQALIYSELVRPMLHANRRSDLIANLDRARQSWPVDASQSLPPLLQSEAEVIIAIDRWSGRLNETARYSWAFLNRALAANGRDVSRILWKKENGVTSC